jgi:hypothetical protein
MNSGKKSQNSPKQAKTKLRLSKSRWDIFGTQTSPPWSNTTKINLHSNYRKSLTFKKLLRKIARSFTKNSNKKLSSANTTKDKSMAWGLKLHNWNSRLHLLSSKTSNKWTAWDHKFKWLLWRSLMKPLKNKNTQNKVKLKRKIFKK